MAPQGGGFVGRTADTTNSACKGMKQKCRPEFLTPLNQYFPLVDSQDDSNHSFRVVSFHLSPIQLGILVSNDALPHFQSHVFALPAMLKRALVAGGPAGRILLAANLKDNLGTAQLQNRSCIFLLTRAFAYAR